MACVQFTAEEKTFLIELVGKNSVVEEKRTDIMSLAKKKKAWESITVAFNAKAEVSKRTVDQLKKCWINMKARRKKELAEEARSRSKTDGGPPGPDVGAFPEIDAVAPHITHHTGFHFDSDAVEAHIIDIPEMDSVAEEESLMEAEVLFQPPKTATRGPKRVSPMPSGRHEVIQKEVDARLKKVNNQLEQEKEIFQLKLQEQTQLLEAAKLQLTMVKENMEKESKAIEAEERRKEELHKIHINTLIMKQKGERERQEFEAEKRKKDLQALEAKERREEELHQIKLKQIKF